MALVVIISLTLDTSVPSLLSCQPFVLLVFSSRQLFIMLVISLQFFKINIGYRIIIAPVYLSAYCLISHEGTSSPFLYFPFFASLRVVQLQFHLIRRNLQNNTTIVFCWNNCSGYSQEKCFKCNLIFPKLLRMKKGQRVKGF